jgi:hypothetical protein
VNKPAGETLLAVLQSNAADANGKRLQPPPRYGQNDRSIALGRKSWLFAGSERGADRAAAMATLIMTAKLNDVDPLAWLADVLSRIAEHPVQRLDELLPWNCRKTDDLKRAAA